MIMGLKILVLAIALLIFFSGCIEIINSFTQTPAVSKICEYNSYPVKVKKCGENYSTYPAGSSPLERLLSPGQVLVVVDADTKYFDAQGNFIISCGGFGRPNPVRDAECSKYSCNEFQYITDYC